MVPDNRAMGAHKYGQNPYEDPIWTPWKEMTYRLAAPSEVRVGFHKEGSTMGKSLSATPVIILPVLVRQTTPSNTCSTDRDLSKAHYGICILSYPWYLMFLVLTFTWRIEIKCYFSCWLQWRVMYCTLYRFCRGHVDVSYFYNKRRENNISVFIQFFRYACAC